MSLHKEVKGIHVHKNLEPAYDGYFNYIYMNDGTSKRFVNIDRFRIAYEVGGGKIPYSQDTESECLIQVHRRVHTFMKRVLK